MSESLRPEFGDAPKENVAEGFHTLIEQARSNFEAWAQENSVDWGASGNVRWRLDGGHPFPQQCLVRRGGGDGKPNFDVGLWSAIRMDVQGNVTQGEHKGGYLVGALDTDEHSWFMSVTRKGPDKGDSAQYVLRDGQLCVREPWAGSTGVTIAALLGDPELLEAIRLERQGHGVENEFSVETHTVGPIELGALARLISTSPFRPGA